MSRQSSPKPGSGSPAPGPWPHRAPQPRSAASCWRVASAPADPPVCFWAKFWRLVRHLYRWEKKSPIGFVNELLARAPTASLFSSCILLSLNFFSADVGSLTAPLQHQHQHQLSRSASPSASLHMWTRKGKTPPMDEKSCPRSSNTPRYPFLAFKVFPLKRRDELDKAGCHEDLENWDALRECESSAGHERKRGRERSSAVL